MYTQLFAPLFLLLSVFQLAAARNVAAPGSMDTGLQARQVSATPSQQDLCLDYERTANMSIIGANSSYRTVVMQKANVGTLSTKQMLDAAVAKLPPLTKDVTLNAACGNWTEIALREAAKNFTMGIVAQFTTEGLPTGIYAGPIVLVIVGLISALLSAVWIFAE
ncbi:hypothetical protein ACJQWK_09062 [Exserohilum turcicum]|uniref:Uncharacterized protein n=1 Tax=Exserohilum turcicum (strain 28A) TaxID=671987 RepID=R0KGB0_EXST2|nr:uncharacterized protein SETTUDRAFT_163122 [Exserohilum turcica Et28A]EOA87082.1 hypothetical protein SETTUDRAFT_163122 [Exserohilum turcica Et28A]